MIYIKESNFSPENENYFSENDFNFNSNNSGLNAFEIFKIKYSNCFENLEQNKKLIFQIKNYLFTILNLKSFNFNLSSNHNLKNNSNSIGNILF